MPNGLALNILKQRTVIPDRKVKAHTGKETMIQYQVEQSRPQDTASEGTAAAGTKGVPMSPIAGTMKQAKRLIILIFGITVICLGIAMIVLPGPAVIVIPLGLAVLATEFVWAKRLLHGVKERLPHRVRHRVEQAGEWFEAKYDQLRRKVKERLGKSRS